MKARLFMGIPGYIVIKPWPGFSLAGLYFVNPTVDHYPVRCLVYAAHIAIGDDGQFEIAGSLVNGIESIHAPILVLFGAGIQLFKYILAWFTHR
jgi:hypothetical protein